MSNLIPMLILLGLILIACGESRSFTKKQKQGKKIYESLCDKCHTLIAPNKHTDIEWKQAVELYGTKLRLQQADKDAVVAYLTLVNEN